MKTDAFAAAGINTVSIPRGYGPALLFQHDVKPWDMKEVRQATALVINREENAFLTNGLGATGTVYMSDSTFVRKVVTTRDAQGRYQKETSLNFNEDTVFTSTYSF